jgi:hypothetical protein
LAFLEGNMLGPSWQDCEKAYARTGIPSVEYVRKSSANAASAGLI